MKPTERLVGDLKAAGYRLYVLSNMSREFIDFLRRFPVYGLFDGEVVSCEEHTVKPEPRIYEILLERYGLTPSETLFIDDREMNIEAAFTASSSITAIPTRRATPCAGGCCNRTAYKQKEETGANRSLPF